ncbi:MarR family winged helix-turn-helix transcriptional regulator [Sphingomonas sp. LaA6.9]|uniref:MarR family winged helix-turn-helix transcriptional regulator n=1 Tax=Sphingomonas sp. LaA6.9 TaxID=2919914 RepID=UPI001F501B7A|nr:helix-turn-helix domain-containing protein [Sphingomonas sp. LaA6.9]MCJ8156056.1 MarR family transcriptional regulator [Sphingomonas sp. LaA6.9]
MQSRFDSLNPLVVLVDETSRLSGRLKSVFADVRRSVGLGESEMMVLAAVVEAERAPTVPQIGRSLGHPRQLIQRAANALIVEGLIDTVANPDHKRATLLRATERGVALKRQADARADAIARSLSTTLDLESARDVAHALGAIRRQLEAELRIRED